MEQKIGGIKKKIFIFKNREREFGGNVFIQVSSLALPISMANLMNPLMVFRV